MIESILGIVEGVLHIWGKKLDQKYPDMIMKLKKEYYEEMQRPESERSNAVLDYVRHELRNIADAIATRLKSETP